MSWLSLMAQLGININPYVQGLFKARAEASAFGKHVETHMGKIGSSIKGQIAGAFSLGALAVGTKNVIAFGGQIEDLHEKTDLTRHDVQALQYAAEQTGGSFEDLAKAMKTLALARDAALDGSEDKLFAFGRLGITLDALKSKTPQELFMQIAKRVQDAGSSGEYLTSVLGVMGTRADSVIPLMRNGVGDLISEFDRLGLAIEDSVIRRLDQVGDEWDQTMRKIRTESAPLVASGWQLSKLFMKTSAAGMINGWMNGKNGVDVVAEALADSTTPAGNPVRRRRKPLGLEETKLERSTSTDRFRDDVLTKQVGRLPVDALAQVGGFIGGVNMNPVVDVARQQLRVQQEIARNTKTRDWNNGLF